MKNARTVLLEFLRAQFQNAAKEGISLTPEGIDKYLETIQKDTENEKILDQVAIAHLTMQHAAMTSSQSDLFKSVNEQAIEAYKASLLINGGAAVALLALAGHALSVPGREGLVADLATPLTRFVAGTLLAALAAGLGYATQRIYQFGKIVAGHVWNVIAVGVMVLSYVAFAVGAIGAYNVFRSAAANTPPRVEVRQVVVTVTPTATPAATMTPTPKTPTTTTRHR